MSAFVFLSQVLMVDIIFSVEAGVVVRVGSGGKLEVDLVKQSPARWQGLGSPLDLNAWFGDIKVSSLH